jgi:hypothetical protein
MSDTDDGPDLSIFDFGDDAVEALESSADRQQPTQPEQNKMSMKKKKKKKNEEEEQARERRIAEAKSAPAAELVVRAPGARAVFGELADFVRRQPVMKVYCGCCGCCCCQPCCWSERLLPPFTSATASFVCLRT